MCLLSLQTVPAFAINQRAFLLRTSQVNILWDCITTLDEDIKTLIAALDGLNDIAILHPHYYTTMQDRGAEFDAPIYLHAHDREWIMRNSTRITLWEGDTLTLAADVSLTGAWRAFCWRLRAVLARDKGVLLSGDIVQELRARSLLCGAIRKCCRCWRRA